MELLQKAANDLGNLVKCVNNFANWWSKAETMLSALESKVVSADGQRLSKIRTDAVQKRWEVVKKNYMEYKTSVRIFSSL